MATQYRTAGPIEHLPPAVAGMLVSKLLPGPISDSTEERALRALCSMQRSFVADEVVMRQDSRQMFIFMIVEGMAYRYRYLANGGRQIFGYLLPGDLCDAQFLVRDTVDHDVAFLTDGMVAAVRVRDATACATEFPRIRQALVRSTIAEGTALRASLFNVGQHNALQRLSCFICEMVLRLQHANRRRASESFRVPLSQLHLADTLGLTVGHVSRCMQQLERSGFVLSSRREFLVRDFAGLRAVAKDRDGKVEQCIAERPLLQLVN